MTYEEWFNHYHIQRKPKGYVPEKPVKVPWWRKISLYFSRDKKSGEETNIITFKTEI
jgi:hypothetical protein